jgi:hypothetical protein
VEERHQQAGGLTRADFTSALSLEVWNNLMLGGFLEIDAFVAEFDTGESGFQNGDRQLDLSRCDGVKRVKARHYEECSGEDGLCETGDSNAFIFARTPLSMLISLLGKSFALLLHPDWPVDQTAHLMLERV